MYKVTAPNKNYNGISAGVHFINGVAMTDQSIDWFKSKGYTVEKIKEDKKDNKKENVAKNDKEDKKENASEIDKEEDSE